MGGTAAMAEWARRNQSEFYRLYARLISADSTTEVRFRDINDLSDAELLGIVTAGRGEALETEPDIPSEDDLH